MKKRNTKEDIQKVALDLFSTQGYEATSMSQIADAIGICKASLYSHFNSKQEILDSILNKVLDEYDNKSIFYQKKEIGFIDYSKVVDRITSDIKKQIKYIIHDNLISKGRKMLTIEQFRNPLLSSLQTKQNYSDVMSYYTQLMTKLIDQEILCKNDPQIMAAQFCLPITVWINLCDREPNREDEVMELIDKHIKQFFAIYQSRAKE